MYGKLVTQFFKFHVKYLPWPNLQFRRRRHAFVGCCRQVVVVQFTREFAYD